MAGFIFCLFFVKISHVKKDLFRFHFFYSFLIWNLIEKLNRTENIYNIKMFDIFFIFFILKKIFFSRIEFCFTFFIMFDLCFRFIFIMIFFLAKSYQNVQNQRIKDGKNWIIKFLRLLHFLSAIFWVNYVQLSLNAFLKSRDQQLSLEI